MGYYVEMVDCQVFIPKTSFESACTHLKNIGFLTDTEHMNGGRWNGTNQEQHWYSWVNMEELGVAIETNNLPEVLRCFGFVVILNDNGDIDNLAYNDKMGDEEHLLHSLAGFFRNGDYLQWRGEEGETWKDVFENGKMSQYNATIIWSKS